LAISPKSDLNAAEHLSEGDASGFDDNSERIPVVWPDAGVDESCELRLLHALEDCGATIADVPAAIRLIERFVEQAGDLRAGETLHVILQRLRGRDSMRLRLALVDAAGVPENIAAEAAKLGNNILAA
jgi:hypothetical protein